METVGLSRVLQEDQFECFICGNVLFEVEQVSKEKVRLTCENCGQCHLIVVGFKDKDQILIKFCDENKNKLNFT
jgi:transcription elongation factor Elf1